MENLTIAVPNGTTNHGNPNLICTPVSWSDSFIFFSANYFAHAFTVKQLPGEELNKYIVAVLAAILYPYCGLPRGIESIMRRAILFRSSELETACRAGALCVVVRSSRWTPVQGQKPIKGAHLRPTKIRKSGIQESEIAPLTQPDDVEMGVVENLEPSTKQVTLEIGHHNLNRCMIPRPSNSISDRKIHGLNSSIGWNSGYEIAILPDNAIISANADGADAKHFCIASSYNFAQVIVSLVQLVASSVTLYRARGDQLSQYGYAAFGLTVLPYITMSIVNVVGNLATPNYQAVYLVHSPELEEARLRGAKVDGTVGRISEEKVKGSDKIASFHSEDGSKFTVSIGDSSSSTNEENFQVDDGEDHPPAEGHGQFPYLDILSKRNEHSQVLEIPACTPFQTSGNQEDHQNTLTAMGYVFFIIPYVVIGILTHFHKGKSTTAQRAWVMCWLVFDTVFGYAVGKPDHLYQYDVYMLTGFMIILSTPAIGGFIVVGQMLKHYGNCVDVNAGF